jgi:hypothetical protein
MQEHSLTPEKSPSYLIRCERTGLPATLNPNWQGGKDEKACEWCGRVFLWYGKTQARNARFCSSQCYGDWMHEHPESLYWRPMKRDWNDLAALYESGLSTWQLAEHYGCSRTAVRNAMKKLGIAPRPQGGYRPR